MVRLVSCPTCKAEPPSGLPEHEHWQWLYDHTQQQHPLPQAFHDEKKDT